MTNYGPKQILDLNTSFEWSLSKLSLKIFLNWINGTKVMAVKGSSTATPPPFV